MEISKPFLSGQAKNDFYKWFLSKETLKKNGLLGMFNISGILAVKIYFSAMPDISVQAIVIAWFDSIGFHIGRDNVETYWLENSTYYESLNITGYEWVKDMSSYAEAIQEANECYNRNFSYLQLEVIE